MKIFEFFPLPALLLAPHAPDFKVVMANNAYLKITGKKAVDLLEKGICDVFLKNNENGCSESLSKLNESLLTVTRTQRPDKLSIIYNIPVLGRNNFEQRYWEIENTPITADSGEIEYIVLSLNDVTDTSKTDEALEQTIENLILRNRFIETILECIPIGIGVNRIDDGAATFVNKRFSEIYGWPEAEFTDIKTFFEKIYPDESYRNEISARILADIQTGDPERMHWENITVTTSAGEKRIVNAKNIPLFDQNLMVSTVIDVTRGAEQTAEIHRIKTNQEALIDGTEDEVWSIDKSFRIITCNKAYQRTVKRVTGNNLYEGDVVLAKELGEELNKKWEGYYRRALNGERFTVKEQTLHLSRDRMEYRLITFNPMFNADGDLFGVACYSKDITEDTYNLMALENAKAQLTKVMNSSLDMICSVDEKGIILTMSAACETILGYKADELIGKPLFDFMYPEDRKESTRIASGVMQGNATTNFENRYVRKDGTLVSLYWSANWDPKEKIRYGVARDATEKKKSEAALVESEMFLNEAQKLAKMGSWNFDCKTDKLTWSDALYDVFDADKKTFNETHISFVSLVVPDDRELVLQTSQNSQHTGDPFNIRYRIVTPLGGQKIIEEFGYSEKNPDGTIKRLFGTAQDITQQKEREGHLKLLESVITHTNDAVVISEAEPGDDAGARIIYINEAFTRMTGYSADEVIGKAPDILHGPNTDQAELTRLGDSQRNWTPCEVTIINYKKNGEEFWLNISTTPVADEKGRFTHWITIGRDVTEQKLTEQRIQAERNLLRTLIDNLPQAVYFKDKHARKLISNKIDYEMLGAKAEKDLIGKTDLEIFAPDIGPVAYDQDMAILNTGKSLVDHEHAFTLKNGTTVWFLTTKIPLYNEKNEIIGILGIGRDITEQKQADEKLKTLNAELERNVKQLVISNSELEQFAYVTSHDLQEPLRMITSFLTQLENKYGDRIDDKGRRYIYFAVDGAKRMRNLILDLLEFSRVGRTEEDLEKVDFNELVKEILPLYRRSIDELKAVIRFENLPTIQTYKTPVRQVFQNLIGNSLKYHNPSETPVITISCEMVNKFYQFSVKDNGIGIAAEYFDKIFIIFQRLHNKDEYSGTGMGLAVAKKIIENLGGKIWVKSEEGKGTTFYLTIQSLDGLRTKPT